MADDGKTDSAGNSASGGGGWWGSLWNAAKQQTEKVCEMVSHDLAEFTSTMQTDTKKVVEKTKETLQANAEGSKSQTSTDRVRHGFHSLMSGITKALTVEPEDTSAPKSHVPQAVPGIFDRAKARLRAIQTDTGTYLHEPSGPVEQYADWLKTFDLDAHKGQISDLLVSMVEVRSLYTSLVPSEVSHQDFWRRYFYKVHQLEMDEARKKALMKRAERSEIKEDSIGWDEEDDWSDTEDASPGKKSSTSVKPEDPSSRLQPSVSDQAQLVTDQESKRGSVTETGSTIRANTISDSNIERETKSGKNSSDKHKVTDSEIKPGTNSVQPESKSCDVVEKSQALTENAAQSGKPKGLTESVAGSKASGDDSSTKLTNMIEECDSGKTDKENKDVRVMKGDEIVKEKVENTADNTNKKEKKAEVIQQDGEVTDKTTKEFEERAESDQVTKDNTGVEETAKARESQNIEEKELKTKVKGDMVVVGERISPSSESSGNKESSNDDWEQDFDVDVTPEDMAAASELAKKMNQSATDYNKLTGDVEEDWENWD